MSKQIINRGAVINDGSGDSLRNGADKINSNFDEIYNNFGNGSALQFAVDFTTGPAAGQTLQYDAGTGKFTPGEAGAKGDKGDKGDTGADSTVPGPQGLQGPTGPAGADSTVPGPQGEQGPAGTGSGDVNSTGGGYVNNAIIKYSGTSGTVIQNSLVTIDSTGAIKAPNNTSSMIPFYYPTLASFPVATESHGAVAHAHDTGKLYYAHGSWLELANMSDIVSGSGTVTSVSGVGTVNGLTLTGTVTNSGDLTLGGTLAISATQVTSGTLPVVRGGTGTATPALVAGANITISGTWPNQTIAASSSLSSSITWSISSSGSTDYIFNGPGIVAGNTNDPVLYLYRGFTYVFVNTTGGSHPFAIRVSAGGSNYTPGVSGSQTGTQTFVVPMNAPSTLYYQCTLHSSMGNVINII